jgi:hypothetical protein
MTLNGMISVTAPPAARLGAGWGIFVLCLVMTPLILYWQRSAALPWKRQLAISTIAFPLWAFCTGGVFAQYPWYASWLWVGTLIMGAYTFVTGAIPPK